MKVCYKKAMTMYNPEEINIVFSTDEKYSKYCLVAITSIKESQKDFGRINAYILAKSLSDKTCAQLEKLSDNILKIHLIKFESLNVDELKIENATLPDPTYYKLLIPDMLPELDKVLYLDCDIIVKGSLKELWQTNINDYLLAAANDVNEQLVLETAHAPQDKQQYFNAGIMLMNLKKWREENTLERLKNFVKNPTTILQYNEQCILNFGLKDSEILFLEHKWNFHHDCSHPDIENAIIIHYVWEKPWRISNLNAHSKYYWETIKKTQWRNERFVYNILNPFAPQYRILKRKTFNFIKNKIIKKCRIK